MPLLALSRHLSEQHFTVSDFSRQRQPCPAGRCPCFPSMSCSPKWSPPYFYHQVLFLLPHRLIWQASLSCATTQQAACPRPTWYGDCFGVYEWYRWEIMDSQSLALSARNYPNLPPSRHSFYATTCFLLPGKLILKFCVGSNPSQPISMQERQKAGLGGLLSIKGPSHPAQSQCTLKPNQQVLFSVCYRAGTIERENNALLLQDLPNSHCARYLLAAAPREHIPGIFPSHQPSRYRGTQETRKHQLPDSLPIKPNVT